MHNLIIEFEDEETRDQFLGQLSDGGLEDTIDTCFTYGHNKRPNFDYSKAFEAWGWDGKGIPIVRITTTPY